MKFDFGALKDDSYNYKVIMDDLVIYDDNKCLIKEIDCENNNINLTIKIYEKEEVKEKEEKEPKKKLLLKILFFPIYIIAFLFVLLLHIYDDINSVYSYFLVENKYNIDINNNSTIKIIPHKSYYKNKESLDFYVKRDTEEILPHEQTHIFNDSEVKEYIMVEFYKSLFMIFLLSPTIVISILLFNRSYIAAIFMCIFIAALLGLIARKLIKVYIEYRSLLKI